MSQSNIYNVLGHDERSNINQWEAIYFYIFVTTTLLKKIEQFSMRTLKNQPVMFLQNFELRGVIDGYRLLCVIQPNYS